MSPTRGFQTLLLACTLWGTSAQANESSATPTREPLAFELSIQADDKDIAPWMGQHLELQRYQGIQDRHGTSQSADGI